MFPQGLPSASSATPLLLAAARRQCRCRNAPARFGDSVHFAPACPACGLDLTQFNVGDGPAAFLKLIVGTVMVTMAAILEVKVHPPLWVHVVLWTPLTALAVIGALRLAKGALLTLHYRHKAREGGIKETGT